MLVFIENVHLVSKWIANPQILHPTLQTSAYRFKNVFLRQRTLFLQAEKWKYDSNDDLYKDLLGGAAVVTWLLQRCSQAEVRHISHLQSSLTPCPIYKMSTHPSCILQDLFRDTPLDHIWRIWPQAFLGTLMDMIFTSSAMSSMTTSRPGLSTSTRQRLLTLTTLLLLPNGDRHSLSTSLPTSANNFTKTHICKCKAHFSYSGSKTTSAARKSDHGDPIIFQKPLPCLCSAR